MSENKIVKKEEKAKKVTKKRILKVKKVVEAEEASVVVAPKKTSSKSKKIVEVVNPTVKSSKLLPINNESFAVVNLNGNQEIVSVGMIIDVDLLENKESKNSFVTDEVLMTFNDGSLILGTPKVQGAEVKFEKLEDFKGKKVKTRLFRAKSRYRKIIGSRKHLSKLKVVSIKFN